MRFNFWNAFGNFSTHFIFPYAAYKSITTGRENRKLKRELDELRQELSNGKPCIEEKQDQD